MDEVRIGCSGWNYSDWRGDFYPRGVPTSRWLDHYASVFDTVEVNATFYRLPKRETTRSWAEQVPDRFVFAIKGSRYRALPEEHGASLALGGDYSDCELDGWRRRVASWRARRPVYVYLNNDWQGFAPRNAAKLRAGLS